MRDGTKRIEGNFKGRRTGDEVLQDECKLFDFLKRIAHDDLAKE